MVVLLRLITLVILVSGLLILISMVVGQLTDEVILVGSEEVEGRRYILYTEDRTHGLHIPLAGTRCFDALPPVKAHPDWDTTPPPVTDHRRFFLEYVNQITELLIAATCPNPTPL